MDLQGVALNEIFTMVAHNYDICFVTNQSVEKKIIFIKVSDKPWPEVIDSILQANNLTFRLIGQKVFAITPNREK